MKFCNHCGAQLIGDERFCASCGADVNAPAPASSAPTPVPVPTPAPVAAVQYAAPAVLQARPAGIADPFAFHAPVVPAAPMAEVPHSHSGVHWSWIILAVVIAAGYYYNKQNTPDAPGPAPAQGTPAGAPAQGTPAAPAPGAPAPQPGDPAQPAAAPPAGNSPNAALLQQQSFAGHWQSAYGTIQVTNGVWTNHSNVALQSAVLECDQYSATGADLSQWKENLTGPVAANSSATFNAFQMGAVNNLMSKVNCAIVDVTPAN
jgi:hypothetical protein